MKGNETLYQNMLELGYLRDHHVEMPVTARDPSVPQREWSRLEKEIESCQHGVRERGTGGHLKVHVRKRAPRDQWRE